MKVRLKKNYKTKGHEHFLPKNKLIELYENFSILGNTWYNTAWGFALDATILTTCLLKWRTSFGDN